MAENATVTLILRACKDMILVKGDGCRRWLAKDAKDVMEGAGGTWDRSLKGWTFCPGAKEAILRLASEKITIQNNLADSDAPRDRSRSRERKASTYLTCKSLRLLRSLEVGLCFFVYAPSRVAVM